MLITPSWTAGPFCHRTLLTLEEKNIPYSTTLVDFDNKPDWLFEVNPKGTVPVMKSLSSGAWTVDSGTICDMLEKEHPEPAMGLLEDSPQAGLDILGKFSEFLKAEGSDAADKEEALVSALTALDDYLSKNGPFICGEKPGATDAAVMPRLYHMREALKALKKNWSMPGHLVAVTEYMKAMEERNSWKNTYYAPEYVIRGWERHLAQHKH